jgi:hypothetical protein
MPQPLPLKNAISFPLTTTLPPPCPIVYSLPKNVTETIPTYHTPESSGGTGSPLGHPDGLAVAVGTGVGEGLGDAVSVGADAAGV